MAIQQVEELGLQRRAGTVGVEIREKGVLGVFENRGRFEPGREPFRQPRLANPDWAFDGEIVKGHSAGEYSL